MQRVDPAIPVHHLLPMRHGVAVFATVLTLCAAAHGTDTPKLLEQAKNGDATSQYWLSVAYARGDGVPVDMSESFRWAKAAAEQGNIDAQRNLGLIFSQAGPPEIRNLQESLKWFMRAAGLGDAESQYNAGLALMNGEGVDRDQIAAVELWKKASAQGYPEAECYLGLSYLRGYGVDKNPEEARKLLAKAAMHEVSVAQYNLAQMCWEGTGGEANKVESFAWMILAHESGSKHAEKVKGAMATNMSSEEIADAQIRARNIRQEIKTSKKKP